MYKVVKSNLWFQGTKYSRGDTLDLDDAGVRMLGNAVEETAEPKPKAKAKPKPSERQRKRLPNED